MGGGFAVLVVFGVGAAKLERDAGVGGVFFCGGFQQAHGLDELALLPRLQAFGQMQQRGFVAGQGGIAGGKLPDFVPLAQIERVIKGGFQLFFAAAHLVYLPADADIAVVFLHLRFGRRGIAQPAAVAVLAHLATAFFEQAAAAVVIVVGAAYRGQKQQRQQGKAKFVHRGLSVRVWFFRQPLSRRDCLKIQSRSHKAAAVRENQAEAA